MLFAGYLNIPSDGVYTFFMKADMGALLRIHDATVIDEDFGYTGGREISRSIRLQAGLHPFRLYYARGHNGTPAFKLEWSGPQIPRQPIPPSAFQHKADAK
jgi:hypothetical protein